jgi:RNA polymerase sigma-70 factor, ECF subfamily
MDATFNELTEQHRRELQLHCYRILGSVQDAEDMVQETLLAAWRGFEGFEGRASLRTWLYRIATNRCLNALRDRARRPREVPAMADVPEPTRMVEPVWLEPYPDSLLEERYEARESVELAFIVALQHLPARQRAALVLADVLGYRTAEIAEMLDAGETAIKGTLQRARARLPVSDRERAPRPDSAAERKLVARFADAVHSGDVDAIVALLTDDAVVTMPPQPLLYQGREDIAAFMRHQAERRGVPMTLVPTRANTQPAFACYLPGDRPYGLFVLTLEGDAVAAITWFGDTAVFHHFAT